MPTFVDLFSGAGGLSLGFKQAGWTSLLAVDNWSDALSTYNANFSPDWLESAGQNHLVEHGNATLQADLATEAGVALVLEAMEVMDAPDWIIGGPPCKGFSTVGKRDRDDPRNQLVRSFASVVSAVMPQGFLIENVLGLRDMNIVESVVEHFTGLGYSVVPAVLRAADYGVPQLRRRIVFVGHLENGYFMKPVPQFLAEEWRTVWEAIGDLPPLAPGEFADEHIGPPLTEFQEVMRGGQTQLQGHRASRHPPHLVQAIGFIPDGGNRQAIPKEFQPASGFHNSYSRLHSQSPAVAVTQNMGKPSGTRCIHPFQNRGLTAREGARLQTFPDWFHFSSGVTSQREQVANAVPPMLARTLGQALLDEGCWTPDLAEAITHNGMGLDGAPVAAVDQLQLFAPEGAHAVV